ncbi:ADP-ribose pyrophosphatase YjhB, NUDIX family [Jatrophihabitans endophyticus]|uniref:ADP-ribose pyrophosphatase YjhB, NUDIX family n=1 Tax=Jatrophihabitans endophyticus TaxID=1206085 RepID=A0A1M5M515_9ACTN|nr:NUDIX hydrolase [Jatrophihabitans endophyticus]SHG71793.1 ADP-ribose pyrophosphatase YjhB, NUDIX family [Jatrophihabitans endophyticus]
MGDGNGWVRCACGNTHWGLHGAAGLLVTSGERVLLQLRAGWTHNGGTWALPGGARDSHEDALTAALREVREETSLDVDTVTVYDEVVDEHGPWSYTTILARAAAPTEVAGTNDESEAVRWFAVDDVATLPLHYGFAATWPVLRERLPASGTDAAGSER